MGPAHWLGQAPAVAIRVHARVRLACLATLTWAVGLSVCSTAIARASWRVYATSASIRVRRRVASMQSVMWSVMCQSAHVARATREMRSKNAANYVSKISLQYVWELRFGNTISFNFVSFQFLFLNFFHITQGERKA